MVIINATFKSGLFTKWRMAKCSNNMNSKICFPHPLWQIVCNCVEDGRVFLECVLEIYLCGNITLTKYQLMPWESCLYYADMLFFPPPRLWKTLLQLCKSTLCVPWKLPSVYFPLFGINHTTAFYTILLQLSSLWRSKVANSRGFFFLFFWEETRHFPVFSIQHFHHISNTKTFTLTLFVSQIIIHFTLQAVFSLHKKTVCQK